jgi:acetyltransferase
VPKKRNKSRHPTKPAGCARSLRFLHDAAACRAAWRKRVIDPMSAGEEDKLRLIDRTEVVVRTIRPDDAPLLQAFVRRLSPRSRRFRFFVALADLSGTQLDRFVNVEPTRGVALVAVATGRDGPAIVGEARYALEHDHDHAEFAVVVADEFQRRGLGRHLVSRLMTTAWRRGVRRLFGEIKSDNRAMLGLAMHLGFRLRGSLDDDSVVLANMPRAARIETAGAT